MHFSVKTIADLFMFGVENDTKFSFIGNNNQPVKRCINDLVFKCIEWLETMVKDTVPFCLWHSVWSPLQGVRWHLSALNGWKRLLKTLSHFAYDTLSGHHCKELGLGTVWLTGLLGTVPSLWAMRQFSCLWVEVATINIWTIQACFGWMVYWEQLFYFFHAPVTRSAAAFTSLKNS